MAENRAELARTQAEAHSDTLYERLRDVADIGTWRVRPSSAAKVDTPRAIEAQHSRERNAGTRHGSHQQF